jgi:hypothetical protein
LGGEKETERVSICLTLTCNRTRRAPKAVKSGFDFGRACATGLKPGVNENQDA